MTVSGCDDAPVASIQQDPTCLHRSITLILPYYENPVFLSRQVTHLNSLDPKYLSFLHLIVVDDGSPITPALNVACSFKTNNLASFKLFRIEKDVRWNWLAARNIGAHHAKTPWIMMTDIDHILHGDVLKTLVCGIFDIDTIYRFSRRESSGAKIHPHPNSWFMTREMFWRVGGYDEALSGYYGTDEEYRRRCVATAKIKIMQDELVRHQYEQDSSTTHYKRMQPEDTEVKRIIQTRSKDWKPRTLSFPYHEVAL